MLKRFFIQMFALSLFGFSETVISCEDYEYCGDYGGFYNVGDYNLYSFALDMGSYVDYSYTDLNWGGGCGTFSGGCGSAYDLGFSGYSSNYSLGCDTGWIDLQIYNLTHQIAGYLSSYPGVGFSGGDYFPGALPPTYPNWQPTYPHTNPYPTGSFPSTPNPFQPTLFPPGNMVPTLSYPTSNTGGFPIAPPTVRPPYAGCDNITVPCPGGPITRPEDLRRPPVYQPVTTQTGNEPLRYRVPRGVVTH